MTAPRGAQNCPRATKIPISLLEVVFLFLQLGGQSTLRHMLEEVDRCVTRAVPVVANGL